MDHDEFLTIPEVAELLKIADKTVYSLAQRRELPGFKVGGQWRFSRTAIDEWIKEKTYSGDAGAGAPRQEGAAPGRKQSRKGR